MLLDLSDYYIHQGDCIPQMMKGMDPQSMDFAVFSPPFPSMYSYTSMTEDIGNSEDLRHEAPIHLSYFFRGLKRVLKPGRLAICHVTQIPRMKANAGRGLFDFRGLCIRLARRAGLIYEYDWLYLKNPQGQAIRTHSHSLLFVTMERDRCKTRGCLGDYLILLSTPGENQVPINSPEITREEWIDWAEAAWSYRDKGMHETNTLNTREGKGENDTRHICPLQLGVIDRAVRLYSNPGEVVFSPFAGIGSEGYVSLKLNRRFYGCEIKEEYYRTAIRNMNRALEARKESSRTLFDGLDDGDNECVPVPEDEDEEE